MLLFFCKYKVNWYHINNIECHNKIVIAVTFSSYSTRFKEITKETQNKFGVVINLITFALHSLKERNSSFITTGEVGEWLKPTVC